MRRADRLGALALAAAALVWGTTFVVVKSSVAQIGALPFLGLRFCIAAVALWPFARRRPATPGEWQAGAWCGVALLAGYVFQTVGLEHTTSSTSAFVTYLLVLFVPLITAVLRRTPPAGVVVAGGAISMSGLFLLDGANLQIGLGEALTLACAVAFAAHICLLAELAPRHDPLRLTAIQLAVVGTGCGVPALVGGGVHHGVTAGALAGAAYTALAASAVAFTLMVWAQRRIDPARAALLLLLEPVFAAVVGYAAGDRLGWAGAAGALLILCGVVVSEGLVSPARRLAPAS